MNFHTVLTLSISFHWVNESAGSAAGAVGDVVVVVVVETVASVVEEVGAADVAVAACA